MALATSPPISHSFIQSFFPILGLMFISSGTATFPTSASIPCVALTPVFGKYPETLLVLLPLFVVSSGKRWICGYLSTDNDHLRLRIYQLTITERCSRVVSTPALYSGGLGFKIRSGDRIFWGCFVISIVRPGKSQYSTSSYAITASFPIFPNSLFIRSNQFTTRRYMGWTTESVVT